MRAAVLFILVAPLLTAAQPAHAEPPVAVRGVIGFGPGAMFANDGPAAGPFSGVLALDLAWRDQPGHAYVLAYDYWYPGGFGAYGPNRLASDVYDSWPYQGSVEVSSLTIGVEHGPRASASGGFVQLSAGMGSMRVREEGSYSYPGASSNFGRESLGLAVTAQAALRIVPAASPLGLIIGMRSSHFMSHVARAHSLMLEVGLTYHPQDGADRKRDEPEWIEAARDVRNPSRAS